jgi:hypothetical protein
MYSLLQWNCRGVHANFEELRLFASSINPSVVALQETFLKSSDSVSFNGFSVLLKGCDSERRSGGVALLISNGILFSPVRVDTCLQVVAARVTIGKTITICSIYLPPSLRVSSNDIFNLVEQLPPPFLLMGDFNGHAHLWGSDHYDSRGQMLEDVFSQLNLCVFNDGSPTYSNPGSGSSSVLDLTVCDPSLMLDFEWRVHDDLCGSDHFPIVLSSVSCEEDPPVGRWNLKKADWPLFSSLCEARLTEEAIMSAGDPVSCFTSVLLEVAGENPSRKPPRQSLGSRGYLGLMMNVGRPRGRVNRPNAGPSGIHRR